MREYDNQSDLINGDRLRTRLSRQVTESLRRNGHLGHTFDKEIDFFEKGLANLNGSNYLGVLYRNASHPRPVLDMYLLMSEPIDHQNRPQSAIIQRIIALHGLLATTFDPEFDTFLDLIDPRTCLTIDDFTKALNHFRRAGGEAWIVGCRDLRLVATTT